MTQCIDSPLLDSVFTLLISLILYLIIFFFHIKINYLLELYILYNYNYNLILNTITTNNKYKLINFPINVIIILYIIKCKYSV